MEKMRESWTDKRLDDFAAHTDQRFDAVDKRFDAVDRRFDGVDRRLEGIERRMGEGFARFDKRFDAIQHAMIYGTITMSAAIIVAFVAVALAI